MRTIYRYEVPVDDQWHEFKLHGSPLHVAAKGLERVDFWTWHYDSTDPIAIVRRFRVYGTGHPMPDKALYWGTVLAGPFVWHLLEEQ